MSDGGAPASGGVWCRSAAASSLEARFCSCLLLPRRRWPPRLRLRRQVGFAGHARWHRFPVSIYGDDDGLVVFSGDAFWWILIRLLFPGCGVSIGVDGASGEDPRMRFVGLYLLAFGMGLLCTPSGFAFRVSGFVVGAGFSGPLLLTGGGGAGFQLRSSAVRWWPTIF